MIALKVAEPASGQKMKGAGCIAIVGVRFISIVVVDDPGAFEQPFAPVNEYEIV